MPRRIPVRQLSQGPRDIDGEPVSLSRRTVMPVEDEQHRIGDEPSRNRDADQNDNGEIEPVIVIRHSRAR